MAVNGSGRLRRWFVQGIRGGARAAGHSRAQESRRLGRENPPLGQTGKMRVCSPWLAVPPAAPMADSVDGHGARSVAGPDAKITRPNRRKQDCRTMVRSRDFGAAPPTENGCFNRAQVRAAKRPAACAERVPGCGVSSPGGPAAKKPPGGRQLRLPGGLGSNCPTEARRSRRPPIAITRCCLHQ